MPVTDARRRFLAAFDEMLELGDAAGQQDLARWSARVDALADDPGFLTEVFWLMSRTQGLLVDQVARLEGITVEEALAAVRRHADEWAAS